MRAPTRLSRPSLRVSKAGICEPVTITCIITIIIIIIIIIIIMVTLTGLPRFSSMKERAEEV